MIDYTEINGRKFPRVKLGFLPTPLIKLSRLSDYLIGPEIFIKRDDMTGLAFGGNKTRKLEFLIGDALAKGFDSVITGGAAQSNHCRQTAAAAAACGLECHLALGGEEPAIAEGNLLLDKLFGAKIHWCGDFRKGEKIPEIVENLKQAGKKTYIIPYGGSNKTGALGFVYAMDELKAQLQILAQRIDHIVFASSSGGTHAGLIVGSAVFGMNQNLIGIRIDKEENAGQSFDDQILEIAGETAHLIGASSGQYQNKLILKSDYIEAGYGILTSLEANAIRLLAEKEGILVDPVYTGRSFGALLDLISKRFFSSNERVLFWHTGGLPTLFSYAEELAV